MGLPLKTLLIAVACLLALFVAAALIVPSFIDWNDYRAELAAEAEKLTGRPVTVEGDIAFTLLPSPAFEAKGVRLGNLPGGSDPAMLTLDSLAIKLAFWPLLGGRVEARNVVLERPLLLLERLPDGRANWDFGPGDGGQSGGQSGQAAQGGTAPAVSLEAVQIVDGTLLWRDAAGGGERRVEAIQATLSAGSLRGPFTLAGTARTRDVGFGIELSSGALPAGGGQAPVKLRVTLPASGAEALLAGYLSSEGPAFQGTLGGKGRDLAALLSQLLGRPPSPALAQPFEVNAKIKASATALGSEELTLSLGGTRASGAVSWRSTPESWLEVALTVPQVDLDALLAAPAGDGGEGAAPPPGEAPLLPPDLLAPDLAGSLVLSINAATYRGQTIRQIEAAASFRDGVITLERGRMALPGPSDLALTGELRLAGTEPAFEGALSLTSDNLRNLLAWLGAEPQGVPAERLRRLVFGSKLSLQGRQLSLTDLSAQLDSSLLRGSVVAALGPRLGLGAGLTLDRLNLDAYLPPPAAGESQGSNGGSSGTAGGLALLRSFDANLDLKVGTLTFRETAMNELTLQGTLQGGVLTARQAAIADLAGGSATYAGSLDLGGPALDGTLELSARDPEKLARLAGLAPATLAPLGPFGLNANVKGPLEALAFNARLKARGGDFTGAGTWTRDGASTLEVTARHPDLPALLAALGWGQPLPAGFGALDAGGRLTVAPGSLAFDALSGRVGPLAIDQGSLALDLSGQRPAITADLALGPLDLAGLAPGGDGGGAADTAAGERWSSAPLGLEALRAFDVTAKLSATAVTDGRLVLRDAGAALVLAGGVLELKSLSGELNGGVLQASGSADASGDQPRLELTFSLAGLDLEPLMADLLTFGRLGGRLDAKGHLAASGGSEAALVGSLGGTLEGAGSLRLATAGLGGDAGPKVLEALLGPEAKGLLQIKNVADGAALLLQGLADRDNPFVARVTLDQGRATLDQVSLEGHGLRATAEGTVDLRPWSGDLTLSVLLDGSPGEPYYREHRVGPLDDPSDIERSGLLLSGGAPTSLPE